MIKMVYRALMHCVSPKKTVEAAFELWPDLLSRIPQDQRVDFIQSLADQHLADVVKGLSREERVSLMNSVLPAVAREFPLVEIDFLKAFPNPDDLYAQTHDLEEETIDE